MQQLPDDSQDDQTGQCGEDGQGRRLRPDGPLGRRILGGEVDDLDGSHPVPRGQGDGLPRERSSGSAAPEQHVTPAAGWIERLGQAGTGERRAHQDPLPGQLMGGWHDLVVGHHDGRHAEGEPYRARDVGVAVPLRVPDQMQRPAGLEVLAAGQRLADHDRVRVSRVEEAARQELDPVHGHALAAGGARLSHQARVGRGTRSGQRHLQERHRISRSHLPKAGQGSEVAVEP